MSLSWLDQFVQDTACLGPEEILIGLDNHGPQMTRRFRRKLSQHNKRPAYTPPCCTDIVSPSDHNVGAELKRIVTEFYRIDFEANLTAWTSANGRLEESEKRMKLATWVASAWAIVRENEVLLRAAFVQTGFLIALDGSENHLIQVPGVQNYDFTIRNT